MKPLDELTWKRSKTGQKSSLIALGVSVFSFDKIYRLRDATTESSFNKHRLWKNSELERNYRRVDWCEILFWFNTKQITRRLLTSILLSR